MENEHIKQIVHVHLISFEGFFLSFLGPKFLEVFYRGIVSSPHGIGIVFIKNDRIEGFVCGAVNPSAYYGYLLRKKLAHFVSASVGAILKKPSIIPRLIRAVHQPSSSPKGENKATLMSIGVDPEAQGKGIGKMLVQDFLKQLKSKGVREVNLTTDRLNNEKTNEFYKSLDFALKRSYKTPEGREINEYVIEF